MSTIKGLMKHPIIMETIRKCLALNNPEWFLQSKCICAGIISVASEHFSSCRDYKMEKGVLTNDGNLLSKGSQIFKWEICPKKSQAITVSWHDLSHGTIYKHERMLQGGISICTLYTAPRVLIKFPL